MGFVAAQLARLDLALSSAASAASAGGGQVVAATCAPVVLSPCSVGPAFCSDLPGEAPFSDGLARMVGAG